MSTLNLEEVIHDLDCENSVRIAIQTERILNKSSKLRKVIDTISAWMKHEVELLPLAKKRRMSLKIFKIRVPRIAIELLNQLSAHDRKLKNLNRIRTEVCSLERASVLKDINELRNDLQIINVWLSYDTEIAALARQVNASVKLFRSRAAAFRRALIKQLRMLDDKMQKLKRKYPKINFDNLDVQLETFWFRAEREILLGNLYI